MAHRLVNAATMPVKNFAPQIEESPIQVEASDGAVLDYYPSDMSLYERGDQKPTSKLLRPPSPPSIPTKVHPRVLVLVLTDACIFRCKYCYVMGNGRGKVQKGQKLRHPVMDDRAVCRAIDLCGGSPQDVRFFGGEPLIAWDSLVWAVERTEAKAQLLQQKRPQFSVTTNGYLLTREKIQFLKDHNFSLLFSLDGPRDVHDACRVTASGEPTFARVMESLEMLRDMGLGSKVSIRATWTQDCLHIAERLEYLNQLCDGGFAKGVALEPVTGCSAPIWSSKSTGFDEESLNAAHQEATDWCIARARSGKPARWTFLNRTARRLVTRAPAFTECGAGVGYIAVGCDGRIYACHKCAYEIGTLPNGIEPHRATSWFDNRLTSQEVCSKCPIRFLCGGPCRSDGYEQYGKLTTSSDHCAISQRRCHETLRAVATLRNEPKALELILLRK